jgi:predicted AAA+ superfamily ATPase
MDELIVQPWVGTSWEGWIIEQLLIFLYNNEINYDGPYCFRTRDGYELDMVLIISGRIWGIEVKLGSAPGKQDMERLNKVGDLIDADKKVLISRTEESASGGKIISTNLRGLFAILKNEG